MSAGEVGQTQGMRPTLLGERIGLTVVASAAEGLNGPTDVAHDSDDPSTLWITNRNDNTFVRLKLSEREGTLHVASSKVNRQKDDGYDHYLVSPNGIAFGEDGLFSTAQGGDEHHQDQAFDGLAYTYSMTGPTLWRTDNALLGANDHHMDMLHNSPESKGIAHNGQDEALGRSSNSFWVFDGRHNALTLYDFGTPHDPGGDDHSDGKVTRYITMGEVCVQDGNFGSKRYATCPEQCGGTGLCEVVQGPSPKGFVSGHETVPSHLAFDQSSKVLYVANTGAGNVLAFDTTQNGRTYSTSPNLDSLSATIFQLYPRDEVIELSEEDIASTKDIFAQNKLVYSGESQNAVVSDGARVLVDSESLREKTQLDVSLFSGIALFDDLIYLTDNSTGTLTVIDKAGALQAWVKLPSTQSGAKRDLMGIDITPEGIIYLIDHTNNELLRIRSK